MKLLKPSSSPSYQPNSADNYRYPLSWARISVDNDVSGEIEAGTELSG